MGQFSLIFVLAAILIGGLLMFNVQRATESGDDRLTEYQYEYMAREAALAGLESVVRNEVASVTATYPPGDWSTMSSTTTPYNGGYYQVESSLGACSGASSNELTPITSRPNFLPGSHLIEVRATGWYERPSTDDVSHQVIACYARLDISDATPPAFDYAFISNDKFTFNGGIEIDSLNGAGNVHTNQIMNLGPQVKIQGHATYTEPCPQNNCIHNNTQVYSHGQGETVPMVAFDPEDYRNLADMTGHADQPTNVTLNTSCQGNSCTEQVITVPGDWSAYGPENPFVWFIDGNFSLSGGVHLRLPTYSIVVVKGEMSVSGSASITVSGTKPASSSTADLEAWAAQNTNASGESMLGFYINGDAAVGGSGSVVGNFYTNGDFEMNGGGQGMNFLGGVAALGEVTANGGGQGINFMYSSIAQEIVIPGVIVPREEITLVAISEWRNAILKNVSF